MNILIVTMGLPYPLSHGAHLRLYNLIARWSGDHKLVMLSLEDGTSDRADAKHLDQWMDEICWETIPEKFSPPVSRWMVWGGARKRVIARIKKLVEDHEIDVIHYYYSEVAKYGLVSGEYGVGQVLDCVDSQVLQYTRNTAKSSGRGIVSELKHRLNQMRVPAWEKRMLERADATVVVSPVDAECLKGQLPSAEVVTIPNGVDSEFFSTREERADRRGSGREIAFVGNMDFVPNVHAVSYFVEEIFPLVQREIADAVFRVVGKNPVPAIRELASRPGVEVTGFVEDVRDYYEMADVVAIPMVSGGGIKNKVLEAFSMQCAVVATPMGMEAISATSGVHARVAASSEDFARDVVELLRSPEEATAMGRNARKLIEDEYTWSAAAEAFVAIYERIDRSKASL